MLSYRHAFHAGNHADILKHSTLCILIEHFLKKNKPFTYIDTHSGAGLYDLTSEWAEKTGEAKVGIINLLTDSNENYPEVVKNYIQKSKEYFKKNKYPGSPQWAFDMSREIDTITLSELHPADYDLLYKNLGRNKRVHVHNRNGFELLTGITLPQRTLVLIDPSYETDSDYTNVASTVEKFYKRNNTATIAVWYPLVGRKEGNSEYLKSSLRNIVTLEEKFLYVEFSQTGDKTEYGMHGSAMAIINPPWKAKEDISSALDFFAAKLSMIHTIE